MCTSPILIPFIVRNGGLGNDLILSASIYPGFPMHQYVLCWYISGFPYARVFLCKDEYLPVTFGLLHLPTQQVFSTSGEALSAPHVHPFLSGLLCIRGYLCTNTITSGDASLRLPAQPRPISISGLLPLRTQFYPGLSYAWIPHTNTK